AVIREVTTDVYQTRTPASRIGPVGGAGSYRVRRDKPLYGVLHLGDHDLLLELFEHGFVEPDFGRPFHQGGHLIDLILQLEQRIKQILRPRGTTGNVDIDGDDLIHALQHSIGVKRTSNTRAGAHGNAPFRVRHLVPDPLQYRRHFKRDGTGNDHEVGLPRTGPKHLGSESRDIEAR